MDPGPDPLLGKTIQERYRIEKKLGQGGMGAVYLAEHVLIQKRVALKCLHAGLASNPEVVRRFHNEALAATAIGHPNIVDVTDMGYFADGSVFMVLEFLEGRDWQQDLEASGPQPLAKVAHIGIQVCEALAAAGEKGIVHRDLKPENIFLIERQGDPNFVKVLDFGISKFKDGLTGGTRTGELMGTPYYMAPEQVRGAKETNHLADLYSTGVMFYRALAGALPFEAHSLPELVLKIATEMPPSLGVRAPDLPAQVVDLVDSMLLKDPRERPKDFDAVADVLAEFDSTALRRKRRRVAVQLLSTDYGGSVGEAGLGELPPERQRHPTPVHERGPDTAAQGSPYAYAPSMRPTSPSPASPNSASNSLAGSSSASLGGASGGPSMPSPASMAGHPPVHSAAPSAMSSASPSASAASGVPAGLSVTPSHVPGVPRRGSLALPLTVALVGLGAAAAFLVQSGGSEHPPLPQEPTLGAQPQAGRVRVQISTIPPDAELRLDGKPLSNPFDGELKLDDARHELRVTRDGFEPAERVVFLSSEQRIFVALNHLQQKANPPPPDPEPTGTTPLAAGTKRPATMGALPSKTSPPTSPAAPEPSKPEPTKAEPASPAPIPPPPATPPEKQSPLKKIF